MKDFLQVILPLLGVLVAIIGTLISVDENNLGVFLLTIFSTGIIYLAFKGVKK